VTRAIREVRNTKVWVRRYQSGGGGAGINRYGKNVFRVGKSNWKDKRTGEWATGLKKYSVHKGKTPSEMKKHWPWQR
jgi:hypothetical protein